MRRVISLALVGALVFGGVAFANGRPNSSAHGHRAAHARTIKLFALTLQCPVTLSLNGGQLFTVGLIRIANGALTGTQTVAVTGGTGRFRGAQGEQAIEFLSPTEANLTITLKR